MTHFQLSRSTTPRYPLGFFLSILVVGACFAACSGENGDETAGTSTEPPKPDPVTVCEESCSESNPAGKDDYAAYRECLLCDACAHACGTAAGCAAPVDNPPCTSAGEDCAICTASMCAGGQNTDTTFSGHCAAQGQACASNIACVGINNCVVTCLTSGGAGGAGGAAGAGAGGS